MSRRELRFLGDPVLREECRPVEALDDEVRQLIIDLMDTMYAEEGIGLAAPQIGVPLRVFVYDVRDDELVPGALINPEIIDREGSVKDEEGCLSIPGLSDVVERSERIIIRGLDAEGSEVTIEADGLLSRCLQHENDHLDGVLFVDRLSPLKRRLILRKWAKRDEAPQRSGAAL